jgi:deoxyribonuclease V
LGNGGFNEIMILAFDTHYFDNKAKTVCVGFENWSDSEPCLIESETLEGVAEYVPGEFYQRELPCILSLLSRIGQPDAEAIIVDGFVILDDAAKNGLGGHLHERLNGVIPVIGVAKTNFLTNTKYKKELFRGGSKQPLYITALGMDIGEALSLVKSMFGEFRIPKLLKELDRLTKENNCG